MLHLRNILFKTVSKRALWDCAIRCYLLFIVISSTKLALIQLWLTFRKQGFPEEISIQNRTKYCFYLFWR